MKFIHSSIVAGIFLVALASCRKEKTTGPAKPPVDKKMISFLRGDDTYSDLAKYSYDAGGKLVNIEFEKANEIFSYKTNGVDIYSKMIDKADASNYRIYENTLNDKGNLVTQVQKYANGNFYFKQDFYYNADGHLIKQVSSAAGDPDFAYIEHNVQDGVVIESRQFVHGNLGNRSEFTYDPSKTLKNYNQQLQIYPISHLFGKGNKYAIAGQKIYNGSGQLTHDYQYSYQFSADGYCTRITRLNTIDGKSDYVVLGYE